MMDEIKQVTQDIVDNSPVKLFELINSGITYFPHEYIKEYTNSELQALNLLKLLTQFNGEIGVTKDNEVVIKLSKDVPFEDAILKKRLLLMGKIADDILNEFRDINIKRMKRNGDAEFYRCFRGDTFMGTYAYRICSLLHSEEEKTEDKMYYTEWKNREYEKFSNEKDFSPKSRFTWYENATFKNNINEKTERIFNQIYNNRGIDEIKKQVCLEMQPIFELTQSELKKLVDCLFEEESAIRVIRHTGDGIIIHSAKLEHISKENLVTVQYAFISKCPKEEIAFANADYLIRRLRLEGADASSAEGIRKYLAQLGD